MLVGQHGIRMLANIIIIDPIEHMWFHKQLYLMVLLLQLLLMLISLYHDQYPTNQFFPLAIEVFGCLYQKVDNFLHWCANMVWSLKGFGGLPLLVLHSFYMQKVSTVLQQV